MTNERLFGYTYGGSALVARRPMTEARMLDILENPPPGTTLERYQVYELFPVKIGTKSEIVTQVVTKLTLENE